MRALLITLAFFCACACPLSFSVAPSGKQLTFSSGEFSLGQKEPLIATLENRGARPIRVGASEGGNVHVESLVCDGRPVAIMDLAPADDCCFAGSCTGLSRNELRAHIRELQPGERVAFPLHLEDIVVEPEQRYRKRWFMVPHAPARCVLRFVYRSSALVGPRFVARANPFVFEVAPARPVAHEDLDPLLPQ